MNNHDPFIHQPNRPACARSAWSRLRHGLLYTIGVGCVVLSMVLVITMIRPETLQSLGTVELAAIVGLMLMPILTLLCLRYDRTVAKSSASISYTDKLNDLPGNPRIAHSAHDRASRVVHHTRLNDPSTSPANEPIDKRPA